MKLPIVVRAPLACLGFGLALAADAADAAAGLLVRRQNVSH